MKFTLLRNILKIYAPTKMLHLPYYAYVFSSTKLEIKAKQVLPGSEEGGRCGGEGAGGRNDQNNVCICE
jgi:hypothetical protein